MEPDELVPQTSEASPQEGGKLAEISRLGFKTRRRRSHGSLAWRETVTQYVPETWPAARLALQARIRALD